jgi:N-acetylglucosamine kinase-like BadF-type ATPase
MRRSGFVIGVDGGGTKTRALVANLTGRVLGRGTAGPSNVQVVGGEATRAALDAAVATAMAEAGVTGAPAAICLGMAGAGRRADRALVEGWAKQRFPGVAVCVVHDGQLVLVAGTPEGWGVAVISGTGSLAYGEAASGRSARAGGWGYVLGDEGSGYTIGLAALRAVARATDGRGHATALTEALLTRWSLPRPQALIRHVYGAPVAREEIAVLASLVMEVAGDGDAVARTILAEAGRELALAAQAVVMRLALPSPVPCALGGGVLLHSQRVRDAFEAALEVAGVTVRPVTRVSDPVEGAVKLALTVKY